VTTPEDRRGNRDATTARARGVASPKLPAGTAARTVAGRERTVYVKFTGHTEYEPYHPTEEEHVTPQPPEAKPRRSRAKTKTPDEEQTQAFDAEQYDDPELKIATIDGHKVDTIAIQFSGTIELDRTNREHVALINRLKIGHDVDFTDMPPLAGYVRSKPPRAVRSGDGYRADVAQTTVIAITDIGGFGAEAKASSNPDPEAQPEGESSEADADA
jgi:hypothetical protein